jgi:hypothetical protein
MVLRPGFGPGSSARKAGILDRTILPERFCAEVSCKCFSTRINLALFQGEHAGSWLRVLEALLHGFVLFRFRLTHVK